MNFLFLRGQIPQDRNPQEIVFNTIEECDDVWTHLIFNMTQAEDQTELWYWGGNREHKFSSNFTERWVGNLSQYTNEFEPDVIFCRGGFQEFHPVLKKFPNAFKIYYGAGRRFLPQPGFSNYNLILQDSPEQLKICQEKFPNVFSSLFIKPSIDHMFFPTESSKTIDICFPASQRRRDKGHKFVFKSSPQNYSIINLGYPDGLSLPDHIKHKRVLKTELNQEYNKCKMGIICSDSSVDSCPRVLPEMISAGLPVVVLNETRFWKDKYITPETGIISNRENFWSNVEYVLNNLEKYNPRSYYNKELSLKKAAEFILNIIRERRN